MDAASFFYVIGIALVVLAVVVSAIGLRNERFPASRGALVLGIALFVVFVGGTTTFAVINANEEQRERDEENAAEAAAEEEQIATKEEKGESGPADVPALTLSADPGGDLAFDKDNLEAQAGEVTIEFDNPASIEHDVVIEQGGKEIAKSDLVSDGQTSVTADLKPGEYTFLCDVPGHEEGGMKGTLTVK